MKRDIDHPFLTDKRAVAPVIGFILIFAIGVVAFSGYQAVQVPQQNAATEFQHSQDVQNDLIGVRSSILTAGQADVSQFPTVKLGTTYRTRILALNPPPAAGTLQTSDAYPIIIENNTGDSIEVDTRFLQYQPGYNELRSHPIWYENSVLYVDAREDGGVAILAQQGLVVEENTIRITALQNEFQQSGSGRVTLELYPTQDVTADQIPTGDLTITLPTRLTAGEYWEQAIGSEDVYVGVTEDEYATGVHELELDLDTTGGGELKLNTVGIQSEPSEGGQKQNVGTGGGGTELPGTLTAEVTQEGGPNTNWTVTMTYDGSEAVDVTADPSNRASVSDTIGQDESSTTLNLGSDPPNQIYPITVTGENNSGQSCSATLNQGDGQINVCG